MSPNSLVIAKYEVLMTNRVNKCLISSGNSEMKKIAKIAPDRENNHTASKNTPCK